MTVSTELSHEEYVGNGITTDFDFRFRIFESRHLIVVVADNDGNETTLKNGTDYTIVGAGSYHGGKVVLNKPLARGWTILLERDLPVVQETDLRNQGKFFAEVHEDAFDYLTMLIQKALGTFSLSLRKPTYLSNYYDAKGNRIANLASPKVGTDAANKDYVDNSIKYIDSKTLRVNDKAIPALPNTDERAGKVLTFDENGYPIAVAPASGSAIDVLNQLSSGDGSLIGLENGSLKDAVDWVTPQMFGAVGDGVEDDTDALQAAINYCAPFEWKGSVNETKKQLGKINAYLKGFGKFRITRPLLLNPFLVIDCGHNGGFYGSNGGFQIIADFDGRDLFAVDTAPYNSDGVRVLGYRASRGDWDNGMYTGCMGWLIRGASISIKDGRNLRGAINRCMAAQSWLFNNSISGGNIGIQTSVTWGGGIKYNHVRANAIPLYNSNDSTIDDQKSNYLSVIGVKPSNDDFTYPNWPDLILKGKTTPVYCEYAHPVFEDNILEGGEVACMATRGSNINLNNNYIEGNSFEYLYAGHSVNLDIKLRSCVAKQSKLLYMIGCNVMLDASSVSFFDVVDWGVIDEYSNINVTGSYNNIIKSLPFNFRVNYSDIVNNGVLNIYLSETGDDFNSGYRDTKPVKTLQEAIDRCKSNAINQIIVNGSVTTKKNYRSGGTVTDKVVDINNIKILNGNINILQEFNELQSLPMGIKNICLLNTNISISNTTADYRPLIPCNGAVNIHIEKSTITGGTLVGCKYKKVGFANITVLSSTLSCALQHQGSGRFSWIDTSFDTTTTNGTVGDGNSKKISSTLYP